MTSPLQPTADLITRAAGWKQAVPDNDGTFRFSLEDGLDFELFSPENSTGILFAVLESIPAQNDEQAEDVIRRMAALAAGSLKTRRSVFSIGERGFELYRTFRLADISESTLTAEVRDFLNDLAWWKKQLAAPSTASSPQRTSPFSFSFDGFFSDGSFQG